MGMSLNALDRADEAIPCFQAALAAEPRFVAAHFNLANTFDATGRHGEAVARSRPRCACSRICRRRIFGMGNALAALGRHAQALPYLERAVGLDPQFALAWLESRHRAPGAGRACAPLCAHSIRRCACAPTSRPRT